MNHTFDHLGKNFLGPSAQGWMYSFRLPSGQLTRTSPYGYPNLPWKLRALAAADVGGKRVIDVGCSEGLFSIYCRQWGAAEVLGVDVDYERILKAKWVAHQLGIDGVSFECRNVLAQEDAGFKRPYDIGLAFGLLHRVPDLFNSLAFLAQSSNTLILEWLGIDMPMRRKSALAGLTKEIEGGEFEWKNMQTRSRDSIHEDPTSGNQINRCDFLNPSEHLVTEILLTFGFNNFKAYRGPRSGTRTAIEFLRGTPPEKYALRRLYLVASREPLLLPKTLKNDDAFAYANWHEPAFD